MEVVIILDLWQGYYGLGQYRLMVEVRLLSMAGDSCLHYLKYLRRLDEQNFFPPP